MTDQEEHRVLREALGAYALGHLTAPEAAEVETHLQGCASCQDDLAEIAPAATALRGAVRPPADEPVPPADLGQRIEERIRAEDRRSGLGRTARTAAVSALAAAAAAAVVVGSGLFAPEPPSDVPLEAVQVVQADGVEATADLVAHSWGVEIKLTATGLQPGRRYEVVVLDAEGAEMAAGEFIGTDAEIRCNLNAAVLRDAATGFVVRDEAGLQVLTAEFSA